MPTQTAIRPWCAVARYPGLREFHVGTITMPQGARHDQIVEALTAHAMTFLPPGVEITRPVCGSIFFSEAEE